MISSGAPAQLIGMEPFAPDTLADFVNLNQSVGSAKVDIFRVHRDAAFGIFWKNENNVVGAGELSWTASSLTPSLLTVENPGPNSSADTSGVDFTVDTTGLSAGTYAGTIRITVTIDGTNTNYDVDITVNLVDTLYQVFLPVIRR